MKIKKASKLKYGSRPSHKKIDTPAVKAAKKEVAKAEKKFASAKAALKVAKKLSKEKK
jgi:hypothetical protein